jgi:hypothetical protein
VKHVCVVNFDGPVPHRPPVVSGLGPQPCEGNVSFIQNPNYGEDTSAQSTLSPPSNTSVTNKALICIKPTSTHPLRSHHDGKLRTSWPAAQPPRLHGLLHRYDPKRLFPVSSLQFFAFKLLITPAISQRRMSKLRRIPASRR